ncbi:hypothetical protein ILUMI_13163 [Ignelater luminosus]|uniref:Uncharacterized protein n=1 Tax=Ignelater luminosus TaxID=2038154 RepID=A0A8K0G8W6_IGNLU|nr:hypothetical protein ILUMI_13163 [Ignelater luminosus]
MTPPARVFQGLKLAPILYSLNSTKASILIIICGNAAKALTLVSVTYKAKNVYPTWIKGEPPGTRFNRSKSRWFDGRIFEDRLQYAMLPILRRQVATKFLEELKKRRQTETEKTVLRRTTKKLNVLPGRGITVEDLIPTSSPTSGPSTSSRPKQPQKNKKKTVKRKLSKNGNKSTKPSDAEIHYAESNHSIDVESKAEEASEKEECEKASAEAERDAHAYIVVEYESKLYPGVMLTNFDEFNKACASCMKQYR